MCVCVCVCMHASVQPPGIFVLLFCISSCSKRAGTRLFTFFFLLSVLRCSRRPYLGSLCRLNHYTSRWEVVLWGWVIDSFTQLIHSGTTLLCGVQNLVLRYSNFFPKINFVDKALSGVRLICTALRAGFITQMIFSNVNIQFVRNSWFIGFGCIII